MRLMLGCEAIPSNFDRYKRGDACIRQELQRLLEMDALHHASRPLLNEEGRLRVKNTITGQVEVGLSWAEVLARAPQYFSLKYNLLRKQAEYGKAVHADLVRIARQLSTPPYLRTATWHCLDSFFFLSG